MNRISIIHLAAPILCAGLLTTAGANASTKFVIHHGDCEVDANGKLNGVCLSSCPPYYLCCAKASTDCKTGRRARVINYDVCGISEVAVDPKKVCQFYNSRQ